MVLKCACLCFLSEGLPTVVWLFSNLELWQGGIPICLVCAVPPLARAEGVVGSCPQGLQLLPQMHAGAHQCQPKREEWASHHGCLHPSSEY